LHVKYPIWNYFLSREKKNTRGWSQKVPSCTADLVGEDKIPEKLTKTTANKPFVRFIGWTDPEKTKVFMFQLVGVY
jgi:hypothetical protein